MQIKKSFELERKGLQLNPYLFEEEADLLNKCKYSKTSNYKHLYEELRAKTSKRLEKPKQVAELYILARIYKYILIKTGKTED